MVSIKDAIKSVIPKTVWRRLQIYKFKTNTFIRLIRDYIYDAKRFSGHATPFQIPNNKESLLKYIIMEYHVVEKGLALPVVRPGFGQEVIKRLIAALVRYEQNFGFNEFTMAARQALANYLSFNREHGLHFPYIEAVVMDNQESSAVRLGGVQDVARDELLKPDDSFFADFAARRFSIRHFTGDIVEEEALKQAIRIAMKTPSVCNRQTAKAYFTNDREIMTKALSLQNGNRGFGQMAGGLYIIASDLRGFMSTGERNQAWIDGGLFSMSLGYAVHSLGYGACMLNWSVDWNRDLALKKEFEIPDHDSIMMMMVVGIVPDNLKVAVSLRASPDEYAIPLSARRH